MADERESPEFERDGAVDAALVTGLVICGGRSRRMGRDKAVLEHAGTSLLQRALAQLDGVADAVLLATGSEPRYEQLGRELVLDALPDAGPLSGLLAGLEAAATPWLAVLAADMPRVETRHLARLLSEAERRELDICMLEGEQGVEPLCAVYRQTCREPVRAALRAGERRMIAFWRNVETGSRLRVGGVRREDFEGADPCININTPEEWARFESEA